MRRLGTGREDIWTVKKNTDDACRNFFKHVKNFSKFEKSEQFDIHTIMPDKADQEIAESMANYFIKVSKEFDPLQAGDIPAKNLYRKTPGAL